MAKSLRSVRHRYLCQQLSALRMAQDISQQELGRRVGRPQTFVSKYELGERRLDVVELLEICEALHVDIDRVIRGLVRAAP